MSWGIAETAPEIEKIKTESADYLGGLNSCGVIDYGTYSYAFDFYAELLDSAYGYGIQQGRKEMCEAVIKLTDVDTRICAFDGGSIEHIFRAYKPEGILEELAHFDKQKFDEDLSTLIEEYGYDGVTETLRKMIESDGECQHE